MSEFDRRADLGALLQEMEKDEYWAELLLAMQEEEKARHGISTQRSDESNGKA